MSTSSAPQPSASETTRFDQLTSKVAHAHTRRSALRLLGLTLLGGASLSLGVTPTSAKDRDKSHHRANRSKPGGRKTDGTSELDRRKQARSEDAGRTPRVSGGTATPQGKYPFAVSIRANRPDGSGILCTGSLIDRSHVLTAAHCTFDRSRNQTFPVSAYTVTVGQVDRTITTCTGCRKQVTAVAVDPAWVSADTIRPHDVAVLTLDAPVDPSIARPIALIAPDQGRLDDGGQVVTVAGWGITTTDGAASPVLREAPLTVLDDANCRADDATQFCTAVSSGRDACSGDSGAPLFANAGGFVQIGVVSGGVAGCPSPGNEGEVYTRLDHPSIRAFIQQAAPESAIPACATCQASDTCCPPSPAFPRGSCAPQGAACPPAGAASASKQDRSEQATDTTSQQRDKGRKSRTGHPKRAPHASGRRD